MKLRRISNVIWSVVLFLLLFFSVLYAYISTDAPYYLSVARDISNGTILYKDLYNIYTPLMMCLNSFIYDIFNNPVYHTFLIYQYLIIGISVLLFYKICQKLKADKVKSFYLSLLLFIAILSSDGTYIILEVYVLLFTFAAFLLLLHKSFFWCGILLSLGFFSKQYGIFNFLPFLLLVLNFYKFQKQHLINFIIGCSVPLLLFLGNYILIHNVSFINLFSQLTGQGYDQNIIISNSSIFGFLAGAKIFILLLIPIFLLKINAIKDKTAGILILGILVNLIPIFIQNFPHYFILTFPYIFILMVWKHQNINFRFVMLSNILLVLISGMLFLRIARYKNVYTEQIQTATKYENKLPRGSQVFLYKGYRFLYFLNDYQNPVLKEVGYGYGFKPDEKFRERYKVLMED